MASTITPTEVSHGVKGRVRIYKWALVATGDTCVAIPFPEHTDKTIIVDGTFAGASVAIQGSIDPEGAVFVPLKDQSDNIIAITVAGAETIVNTAFLYKPVVTGGAGLDLNIWLMGVSR